MYALFFEASGIHGWLTSSGRLRDIAAGSDLLDNFTGPVLDDIVSSIPEAGSAVRWARRAGGAGLAFSDSPEVLQRVQTLLLLAATTELPGLTVHAGTGEGSDAGEAESAARRAANDHAQQPQPELPNPCPYAVLDARTGAWAVRMGAHASTDQGEALSAARARFRDYEKQLWQAGAREDASVADALGTVVGRFLPGATPLTPDASLEQIQTAWDDACPVQGYVFPVRLSADPEAGPHANRRVLPLTDEEQTLAFIYGDGSGLGQILQSLREQISDEAQAYEQAMAAFSNTVAAAMTLSAREATRAVLLPAASADADGGALVPARPILLGGEDISLVIRPDLAIPWVQTFVRYFEGLSATLLQNLFATHGKSTESVRPPLTHLSTGFGILYAKATQPFATMSKMAEDMGSSAKTLAKNLRPLPGQPPASVLVAHRLTTALADDWDTLCEHELSYPVPAGLLSRAAANDGATTIPVCHTLGAYALNPQTQTLPRLSDLLEVLACVKAHPPLGSALRQLLTALNQPGVSAGRRWARTQEYLQRSTEGQEAWSAFAQAMTRLLRLPADSRLEKYPASRLECDPSRWRSPLGDLLTMLAVDATVADTAEPTAPSAEPTTQSHTETLA